MIGVAALVGIALGMQLPTQIASRPETHDSVRTRGLTPTDSSAVAVRAVVPPVIDGKDDDEVWRTAPVISAFKQWQPTEGMEPRFRTEAKGAYDADNLSI